MPGMVYSHEFFDEAAGGSRRSADVVVPLVMDLVRPASVVDVGCGIGTWLSVFKAHGVHDIVGIDGDYVDRARLWMPVEHFVPFDLTEPVELGRTFDLAVSVEVAEHLPAEVADVFVASLAKLASVVLFSAAAPYQGGIHHVNEQWPEYWAQRFECHGFVAIDALRAALWHDQRVEWWYAQNMLLYARNEALAIHQELARLYRATERRPIGLMHPGGALLSPELHTYHVGQAGPSELVRALPAAFVRALRKRFGS